MMRWWCCCRHSDSCCRSWSCMRPLPCCHCPTTQSWSAGLLGRICRPSALQQPIGLLPALVQLQMCSIASTRSPPLSQHGELVKAAPPGASTVSADTTRPSRVQSQLQRALLHARRVLSYSEADALAVLDAAMPVCCPSSTVDALKSYVARGLPAAQLQVCKGACEAARWQAARPARLHWGILGRGCWYAAQDGSIPAGDIICHPTFLACRLSWCAWFVTGVQPGPWQSLPAPLAPRSSPLQFLVVGAALQPAFYCSCFAKWRWLGLKKWFSF